MARELLTEDKTRLSLFEDGVNIDQKLPKWADIKEEVKNGTNGGGTHIVSRETYNINGTETTSMPSPFVIYSTADPYEVKETVKFDEIAAATLTELTKMIKNNELNNILSSYGGMHGWGNNYLTTSGNVSEKDAKKKESFLNKIKNAFKKKVTGEKTFDAVEFFTNVKLTSKASAETYRDRVSSYLKALNNAYSVGQTALMETLLKEMIANKFEALLYSEGYYYVVTEKQVVDFAKKTEKGISLTYLKNYTRPLPQDVIESINKVNGLKVFDNFVILHYDPKGESYKETEKEVAKRKDPILFGVIAGSNKLYYITDWVDEYCDLTLEKFVDTLGIDVEELNFDEDRKNTQLAAKKAEKEKEEKKKKDAAAKKKKKAKEAKKVEEPNIIEKKEEEVTEEPLKEEETSKEEVKEIPTKQTEKKNKKKKTDKK